MKTTNALLFFLLSVLLVACKSDDTTDDTSGNDANYFPFTAGSSWSYDIETDDLDPQVDALFVDGTEQSGGNTYTDINSDAEPFGFVTGIIEGNLLRQADGQLLAKGVIGAPIDGFPGIMITLDDFIMFDANASSGDLSTISGIIEEEVEGIPLEFEYEFKTVALPPSNSLNVNGATYQDVINTGFALQLAVTAQIEVGGFIIPFPILSEQEVINGQAAFAKDTGFVQATSTVDYELEDLSGLGVDLPFPVEATTVTVENLSEFQIGN